MKFNKALIAVKTIKCYEGSLSIESKIVGTYKGEHIIKITANEEECPNGQACIEKPGKDAYCE